MKAEIDKADTDLRSAIGSSSGLKVNLVKLSQELSKIKNSRNRIEAVEYEDAKRSLEYAKDNFEGAT
ncbi:hypothetical protein DB313_05975 (plasmid) [Borrelia turcica IST7]|uniref:Uncharacterized protein n=1 Tax=Borrelia turcica IST7 TaxID=1104446 RepID=A0A386PQC7_9SPIR|nr:hypothetical protein [Borrelia turcica]AYE37049.1 hypothetical protein DB313_05975 [Borrelia turcica IST7]